MRFGSPASRSRSPTPPRAGEAAAWRRRGAHGPRRQRQARGPGLTSARLSAIRGGGGPARRGSGVAVSVAASPRLSRSLPGSAWAPRPNPWFPWPRPDVEARQQGATRAHRLLGASRPCCLLPGPAPGPAHFEETPHRVRFGGGRRAPPRSSRRGRTCAAAEACLADLSRRWRSFPLEAGAHSL